MIFYCDAVIWRRQITNNVRNCSAFFHGTRPTEIGMKIFSESNNEYAFTILRNPIINCVHELVCDLVFESNI